MVKANRSLKHSNEVSIITDYQKNRISEIFTVYELHVANEALARLFQVSSSEPNRIKFSQNSLAQLEIITKILDNCHAKFSDSEFECVMEFYATLLFDPSLPTKQRFTAYNFICVNMDACETKRIEAIVEKCFLTFHNCEKAQDKLALAEECSMLTVIFKWKRLSFLFINQKRAVENYLIALVKLQLKNPETMEGIETNCANASLQDDIPLNKVLKLVHVFGEQFQITLAMFELMAHLCESRIVNAQSQTLAGLIWGQGLGIVADPIEHFFCNVVNPKVRTESECFGYLSQLRGLLTQATSSRSKNKIALFSGYYDQLYNQIVAFDSVFHSTFGRNVFYNVFVLFMKLFQMLISTPNSTIEPQSVKHYIQHTAAFVEKNWINPVEGTQFKMQELFSIAIQLAWFLETNYPQLESHFMLLLRPVLNLNSSAKVKYQLLSLLIDNWPADLLLQSCPDIVDVLLRGFEFRPFSGCVGNAFKRLLVKLKMLSENNNAWAKLWLPALVNAVSNSALQQNICLVGLDKIATSDVAAIPLLLEAASVESCPDSEHLSFYLCCLREQFAKYPKSFRKPANFNFERWKELVAVASQSCDSKLRVQAFQLHCNFLLSTEWSDTQAAEFEQNLAFVARFIAANLAYSLSETRYELESAFANLLSRLKSKLIAANKKDLQADFIRICFAFFNKITDSLICSLRPGATFARESLALALLNVIGETFGFCQSFENSLFVVDCSYNQLLQMLQAVLSPYETTRVKLSQVLKWYNADALEAEQLVCPATQALSMANNVRAHEADSGGQLLSIVYSLASRISSVSRKNNLFTQILSAIEKVDISGSESFPSMSNLVISNQLANNEESLHCFETSSAYNLNMSVCRKERNANYLYLILSQLYTYWSRQISFARNNLLDAAKRGYLHGCCLLISHLILSADLSTIDTDNIVEVEQWQLLLKRILKGVSDISDIVLHIISDESPEGKDFVQVDGDVVVNYAQQSQDNTSTPVKLLLHFGFRSAKEASNLIAAIFKAFFQGQCKEFIKLASFDFVENCGRLLQTLLLSVRHRGAFQTIDRSLGVVISSIYVSSFSSEIFQLPKSWLEATLDKIEAAEDAELCYTRRSAGLPYLVLAIVGNETTTSRPLLMSSMKRLFSIASASFELEAKDHNKPKALSCVHSLNILRVLFAESRLAKYLSGFIADGLRLVIKNFSSPVYSIRNASMTLYGELLARTIGADYFNNIASSCNFNLEIFIGTSAKTDGLGTTLTARDLFTRYPNLLGVISSSLASCFAPENAKKESPQLYPILVLLSRLRRVTNVADIEQYGLYELATYVRKCNAFSSWSIRSMAARALLPLLAPSEVTQTASNILHDCLGANSNAIHGNLLQVCMLLEECDIPHLEQSRGELLALVQSLWENTCISNDFAFESFLRLLKLLDKSTTSELSKSVASIVFEMLTAKSSVHNFALELAATVFLLDFPEYRPSTMEYVLEHGCEEAVVMALSKMKPFEKFHVNVKRFLKVGSVRLKHCVIAQWASLQLQQVDTPIPWLGDKQTWEEMHHTLCSAVLDSGLVRNELCVSFFELFGLAVSHISSRETFEHFIEISATFASEENSEEQRKAVLHGFEVCFRNSKDVQLPQKAYWILSNLLQDDSEDLRLYSSIIVSRYILRKRSVLSPFECVSSIYKQCSDDYEFLFFKIFACSSCKFSDILEYTCSTIKTETEASVIVFAKEDVNCFKETLIDSQLSCKTLCDIKEVPKAFVTAAFDTMKLCLSSINWDLSSESETWAYSKLNSRKIFTLLSQLLLGTLSLKPHLTLEQTKVIRTFLKHWSTCPLNPLVRNILDELNREGIQRTTNDRLFYLLAL